MIDTQSRVMREIISNRRTKIIATNNCIKLESNN